MPVDYSLCFIEDSRCSMEEQHSLLPLIQNLLLLVRIAHRDGKWELNYLDPIEDALNSPMYRPLVRLILDNVGQEEFLTIGLNLLGRQEGGRELLRSMLIMEALHCVMCGISPHFTAQLLHRLLDGELYQPPSITAGSTPKDPSLKL